MFFGTHCFREWIRTILTYNFCGHRSSWLYASHTYVRRNMERFRGRNVRKSSTRYSRGRPPVFRVHYVTEKERLSESFIERTRFLCHTEMHARRIPRRKNSDLVYRVYQTLNKFPLSLIPELFCWRSSRNVSLSRRFAISFIFGMWMTYHRLESTALLGKIIFINVYLISVNYLSMEITTNN